MIKKLLFLLNNKIKIELFFLFLLNCITAFLEVISIGSIPVFLMYIMDPGSLAEKIPYESVQIYFQNILDSTDSLTSLKFVLILLFLLFLVKNLIILFNSIYQAFFNRKISTLLTSGLFNNYLSENYLFFVNNKPSELIKNVESVGTVRSLITIILSGIKETLTILGLIVIIGIGNLKIALLMILIGVIFAIFHKLKISGLLMSYGKKSYIFTENRMSLINEFFGSIIDIKISNKEKFFSKKFRHYIWSYESTRIVDKIVNSTVRPVVETSSIFILISVILFFSISGKTFLEIIPLVALLSLSFIRILPSVVILINYANRIKFESAQLNYLLEKVSLKKPAHYVDIDRKLIKFNDKIEVKNLSFNYSSQAINTISNINIVINKGDTIGIVGKSGAGKTTLLNNLSNLLKFNKGEIHVDGIKLLPNKNFNIVNLGYIRQDIYLLNDTIENNILFGEDPEKVDKERVKESLINARLNKYENRLDLVIGNKGSKISGGENQLLGLARALYRKPEILFLDEPTSNLDYKNEKHYLDTIKNLNITSLIIAHRIKALNICNKIILMKDGKIIDQGNLDYFRKKYSNFENYID